MPRSNAAWTAIFKKYFTGHDFDKKPALLTAQMIKDATHHFKKTTEREVRVLAKMDSREEVPPVLRDKGLFLLPIRNGKYVLVKGEGYMDLPDIDSEIIEHKSALDFDPDTSKVGNSEMQHLDLAYATSIIRTFVGDPSLVLTIRGRKYTPPFSFDVGKFRIDTESVQTEVDGGYEGKEQIVLIEAKNSKTKNTIIRQLYYPFRQWQAATDKKVLTMFFEKRGSVYSLWEFGFKVEDDYNSIELLKSARYKLID